MNLLTIKDETFAGEVLNKIALKFEEEYISVQQLIAARVSTEVEKYKKDWNSFSKGLVLPTDMEKRLNKNQKPEIDVEKQVYVALEAFKNNGFFILIDDEQVEDLNQKFLVSETTNVSFVKLTQLVGG